MEVLIMLTFRFHFTFFTLIILHCACEILTTPKNREFQESVSISPSESQFLIEGASYFLKCGTEKNFTKIYWMHNDKIITKLDQSVVMTKTGEIYIPNVSILHTGAYKCFVVDVKIGEIFSNAVHLFVQTPAKIIEGPEDRNISFGTQIFVYCIAIGSPTPQIFWFINGDKVEKVQKIEADKLSINVTKKTTVTCQAVNLISQREFRAKQSGTLTPIGLSEADNFALQENKTSLDTDSNDFNFLMRKSAIDKETSNTDTSSSSRSQENEEAWEIEQHKLRLIAFIITLTLLSLLTTSFLAYLIIKKVGQKRQCTLSNVAFDDSLKLFISEMPNNPAYHNAHSSCPAPSLERLEYPRNEIIYVRDLGQGAFGQVFAARAPNLSSNKNAWSQVAVKILKEELAFNDENAFLKEANSMASFNHPNVLKLLGICTQAKPYCLILEYMCNGDLAHFLFCFAPYNNTNSRRSRTFCLSRANLANIVMQIASGMAYLSQNFYIHRDLAARNCLVGESLSIKVADFGLCKKVLSGERSVYQQRHYMKFAPTQDEKQLEERKEHDELFLPVRWMPPEAIRGLCYSIGSDVWAYGVVLWEVYSFAQQHPYPELHNEEVLAHIDSGKRLPKPNYMPAAVYSLARQCWKHKAQERISFHSLERRTRKIWVKSKSK